MPRGELFHRFCSCIYERFRWTNAQQKGHSARNTTFYTMPLNFLRAHKAGRCFTLYPNGEWSVIPLRTSSKTLNAPKVRDDYDYEHGEYVGKHSDQFKKDYVAMVGRRGFPLGSSNVSNSVSAVPRGLRGFTRHQKRLARNGCLLLEQSHHKSTLCFLTLTLPPVCADGPGDSYKHALHVFYKWLSRRLATAGLDSRWIGVTEVQEKRLERTGQFALHEHIVFQGRTRYGSWCIPIKEFQDAWNRALEAGYGVVIPVDQQKNSIDVKGIRKSASAYLGKYMSKGVAVVDDLVRKGYGSMLPSTWVHRSADMLHSYRAAITKRSREACERVMQAIEEDWKLHVRWFQDIVLRFGDGHDVNWGRCGYLTPQGIAAVHATDAGMQPLG